MVKRKGQEPQQQTQSGLKGFFAPVESKKKKVVDDGPRQDVDPRLWKFGAWNVAGLRACLKKDCVKTLQSLDADVLILTETKYNPVDDYKKLKADDQKLMDGFQSAFKDYHFEWCASTDKKGYAGVLLMSRIKPIKVTTGIGNVKFDTAGRLIIAEYSNFYLIGAYVMNSGRGLVNLEDRAKYEELFLEKIKELDAVKPVIYGGDLNVAHNEIDLKNPESNRNKTAGFTDRERACFSKLLESGFKDTFRTLHPEEVKYSYWSFMGGARAKNVGWRLDYWVVSERLMEKVEESDILTDSNGSDHAPVIMKITV